MMTLALCVIGALAVACGMLLVLAIQRHILRVDGYCPTCDRFADDEEDAWDEGYHRGALDATSDLEPADNPYTKGDR